LWSSLSSSRNTSSSARTQACRTDRWLG
jgi:hypothetical protein